MSSNKKSNHLLTREVLLPRGSYLPVWNYNLHPMRQYIFRLNFMNVVNNTAKSILPS
jgi:hypothetical protein